jgi:NAD(P)-dependent dehydrogenase (short-subunit alcohol dehydrogenase family)
MAAVGSRTVVVTGNASGIGAAIAMRLASDGWSVVGIDRADPPEGQRVARHIVADLADPAQVAEAATSVRGAHALVHAAGLMRVGALERLNPADGELMWAVHVRALTVFAQILCPAMPSGGRLVAIGSRTSAGAAGKSQYAASKAAMTALVRSWAAELAPRAITANVVAPAATVTPMLGQGDRASVAPILPPIGRYIEPAEVAAYVAFLLSPEAGAITGQELLICGGASL